MFRAWAFTEMPYPYTPPQDTYESVRVSLPNRHFDPETGSQLYEKYYDIYRAADEVGLDIMVNEHHATATCLQPSVPMSMAILARETRQARLMCLGNPIVNRGTPVRVAEEMAMADVISRGRVEVGFVRGVPMELSAGNVRPTEMKERFWEYAELITKAWTTDTGPFNWEGEYFQHRQVNIWPRPYQDPHPPIWVPTQSAGTAREVGAHGYKVATILCGAQEAKAIFAAYREGREAFGSPATTADVGYLGLMFVDRDPAAAYAGAEKMRWYLRNNKVAPQFRDVPGYVDPRVRKMILQRFAQTNALTGAAGQIAELPVDELVRRGYMFAGTPDEVVDQVAEFSAAVGGMDNLMMMVHTGSMSEQLVTGSLATFAADVLPRLRDLARTV